ncbi:MAG TPA: zf-HC2 domain-containing protein [Acidimicrobiales bacterium]|nr:zf-HC2 domain-containing protein [Acidimicrobiales bacterium]
MRRGIRPSRTGRASCMEVARVLQSYLDREVDEVTARRIAVHLETCRRCGLEATTYRAIKASLARRAGPMDPDLLGRLRDLATGLAGGSEGGQGDG